MVRLLELAEWSLWSLLLVIVSDQPLLVVAVAGRGQFLSLVRHWLRSSVNGVVAQPAVPQSYQAMAGLVVVQVWVRLQQWVESRVASDHLVAGLTFVV